MIRLLLKKQSNLGLLYLLGLFGRQLCQNFRTFTVEDLKKVLNTFLFLFSNKMLVIKAGIHKIFIKIANREDPDQTASSDITLKMTVFHSRLVISLSYYESSCCGYLLESSQ